MAFTNLYQGESDLVTVSHSDSGGTAIPHASLDDVRYILRHQNGDTLLKLKKTAPADWRTLTQESTAGQYSFEVKESDTKTWPPGKVYLEWHIKITDADFTDGYKPMGVYELYIVKESNYAKE